MYSALEQSSPSFVLELIAENKLPREVWEAILRYYEEFKRESQKRQSLLEYDNTFAHIKIKYGGNIRLILNGGKIHDLIQQEELSNLNTRLGEANYKNTLFFLLNPIGLLALYFRTFTIGRISYYNLHPNFLDFFTSPNAIKLFAYKILTDQQQVLNVVRSYSYDPMSEDARANTYLTCLFSDIITTKLIKRELSIEQVCTPTALPLLESLTRIPTPPTSPVQSRRSSVSSQFSFSSIKSWLWSASTFPPQNLARRMSVSVEPSKGKPLQRQRSGSVPDILNK